MSHFFCAWTTIGLALVLAILSIPLARRKIPMNHFYGMRFPQAFKSDRHWYEINHHGGKILSRASIPIFVIGLYGLAYPVLGSWYKPACIGVMLAAILLACGFSYAKARLIDREIATEPKIKPIS